MGEEADRLIDDGASDTDYDDWGQEAMRFELYPSLRRQEMVKKAAKKRVRGTVAPKAKTTSRFGEFELMLQSIVETFPGDPTTPGVSLAWLPDKQKFYGSITRFHRGMAEDRYTVYTHMADSPIEVLSALIEAWKRHVAPPSKKATERLLKFRK